jgi:tetratricopeptide (TPR) repeat protein
MVEGINSINYPKDAMIVTQMGGREWKFVYPRLTWEVMEEFHEALEHWRVGNFTFAEEMYDELIDDYPEFIDVHHHLALLLSVTNREEEAFLLWQKVVAMGLDCLPKEFEMGQDLLSWLVLENRPFLRAYHSLGLQYFERREIEKALEIFNNVLAMNPGDNQGVRALVIDCNFHLKRPRDVMAVCNQYPDDGMEQVIYGRVLALYQLGQKDEAKEALQEAIEFLPLVAEELVKTRHRKPKDIRPGYITHGGADQAYYYWIEQGNHWRRTPGALEFVRGCLKKQ